MAPKKTAKPEKDTQATNLQAEKLKALEHALADLDKQFGKGAVMKMGADAIGKDIPVISTGCLTLDAALGVGGIPRGRIVEIYGPESSGKTTVALHVVAEAQKAGGIAAFVDAEHALDPLYARKLGVNIEELYVSQPDTGEQALEITEALVRSGALDVVVIDSVAALVPKAEIDGEMGDSFVGLQARLMSQALRKLTGVINKTGCVAIFINQLREKVGVMYGNPETTPGGRALKFYSSVRLDVRKGEQLKNGSEVIGNRTKVKVVHQHRRYAAGSGGGTGYHPQERRLLLIQRYAAGPGPGQRAPVPEGSPGTDGGNRPEAEGGAVRAEGNHHRGSAGPGRAERGGRGRPGAAGRRYLMSRVPAVTAAENGKRNGLALSRREC